MFKFATKLALLAAITATTAWTADAQTRMPSHMTQTSVIECETAQKTGTADGKETCRQTEQAARSGDYNGDGRVDAGDFTTWQNDSSTDGTVDAADFTIWRRN